MRTEPAQNRVRFAEFCHACQTVYSEKQRSNRFPRSKKPARRPLSQRWEVAAAPRLEKPPVARSTAAVQTFCVATDPARSRRHATSSSSLLDQIEALVRRDPASRGLISTESQLGPLCPGHLAGGGKSCHNRAGVAIVTGFFVPDADVPAAETDGPPGRGRAGCGTRKSDRHPLHSRH